MLEVAGLCLAAMLMPGCASEPLVPYTTGSEPLALLPIDRAGILDERGRFREFACAVLEARGPDLPGYRPCEDALVRVGEEPPGSGQPVNLGQGRRPLVAAVVPGVGWECIEDWLEYRQQLEAQVTEFGYSSWMLRVDGLSGSENNARQIRDAILEAADSLAPKSLVLIGYSKGAPDILTAVVEYPEIHPYIAAVVSVAGAIGGSPLAYGATQNQIGLLRFIPGADCERGDGGALESLLPNVRQRWLADHELPKAFPYYSVVTYPSPERISNALEGTHALLSRIDPRNDGQLIFYDQLIPGSSLLAFLNADHWAVLVPISDHHAVVGRLFTDQNEFPRQALAEAVLRFIEEDLDRRASQP